MTIRLLAATALVALLAACGADGEPTRPEQRPASGITLSGTVQFGIAGGS